MAGNEGSSAMTAARKAAGPSEWGKVRRMAAALFVAFSMVGVASVVFAGTTSAQTDAVLQWLPEIQAASAASGVPAEYIAAVIRVESVGDPNAVSSAGAIGLMQVMPAEFQSQGISEDLWFDPATNILAGSTEIGKFLTATGSIEQALASYFGSGCDSTGTCTGGYISTVLSYAAAYAAAIASGSTSVDLSGVITNAGATANAVDSGAPTGDGTWQGDTSAYDVGGWQDGPGSGEVPDDGWQGESGGDPNWDGSDDSNGDSGDEPADDGATPGAGNGDTSTGDTEPVG